MNTKYIVNNLSGQTINGNPIDPKYKVYTALLTQNGGDDPSAISSDNDLYKGVTYEITGNPSNTDLTPFGAPNSIVGTKFVSNQTVSLIDIFSPDLFELSYNTGAPVVTILENTIGNVWFNYTAAGVYTMASDGLFSTEKTLGFITYNDGGPSGLNDKPFLSIYPNNDYNIYVNSALDGVVSDGVLFYAPIEIRVYN